MRDYRNHRRVERELRARVAYLERVAYGSYPPCPADVPSIDGLPFIRKSVFSASGEMMVHRVEVQLEMPATQEVIETVTRMKDMRTVQLDGRRLVPGMSMGSMRINGLQTVILDLTQVM